MATKRTYFDELKEWSARKLHVLTKYLDPAVKILPHTQRQAHKTVYYVDGFAGRGVYEDGSKGSPVLAAEHAQRLLDERKPYMLSCVNVEEDVENYTNLCRETARFGKNVQNIHGSFAGHISPVLSIIGLQPTLCFLDPFGVEGLDWVAVHKLISRAPHQLICGFDLMLIISSGLMAFMEGLHLMRKRNLIYSHVPMAFMIVIRFMQR